jgi:hypothetical protein
MKGSNMKKILVSIGLVLGLTACSIGSSEQRTTPLGPVGEGTAPTTTSRPFIGPTVPDPQPLTPNERFILAYRSIRPGDVRTDAQVLALTDGCP